MVQVKTENRFRAGRGFGLGEIRKAGAAVAQLKKMKLRADKRRRSVHEANVEELKKLLGQAKEKKQKPKKVRKAAVKKKAKGV